MAAARSRVLPAVLLLLLAIGAAPRAFVGPSRAPPAPAPGAAVASPAAAEQARGQRASLAAGTVAAFLLAAAAAAGRGASAARRGASAGRRAWPLGKTTKQEILELEELSQGRDGKEKKRRWFPFGRKKEEEEADNLKQLMQETQDLAARVALLDRLSADVDAQEEEVTVEAAVNELEAGTVEPTELLAEDAADEAPQDQKELEPEVAEMEEEEEEEDKEEEAQEEVEEAPAEATVPESVPGPEEGATADEPAAVAQEPASAAEEASDEIADEPVAAAEEPLAATEAELPIAEEPEADQAAALEMSAATKVEVPPEGQEVAVDPVDEQREVLESALNMAKVLEADNLRLKEDLRLAQKMCFELLDDKDRDEESAAAM